MTLCQRARSAAQVDGRPHHTLVALHHAVGAGQEFVPPEDGDLVGLRHFAGGAFVVTEQDDAFEMGDVLVLEHGRVVVAEEAAHREQRPGARPGEHVGGFGPFEAGVEGHEGRAGADEAERGDNPLRHVGGPHGHAVAGVDARRHGRAGDPQGVAFELGEGEPDLAVDHGLGVPEAGRGVGHQARDRSPAPVAAGVLGCARPGTGCARRGAGRAGLSRPRPLRSPWI